MTWSFTAAAERALAEAAGWNSRDDRDDLEAPELLLGLLAEPECRAAEMLLARGVDAGSVRRQWPSLRVSKNRDRRDFSPALLLAFEAAVDRLWEYPRPLLLATEHLLLGLAAAPGEISQWLASVGVDPNQLEAQIHRLYGHDPGPLPLEEVGDRESAVGSAAQGGDGESAVGGKGVKGKAPARAFRQRRSTVETKTSAPVAAPSSLPAPETSEGLGATVPAPLARVLDAAANRAREGLRVVEDYVRMVLDDQFLTAALKQVRHDLQGVLQRFPAADLIACRDTEGDVGTTASTTAEFARADIAAVAAANWKRLEEALRSLEEYTKVSAPDAAAAIEQLRYRVYTLERAAEIIRASVERLSAVRLCVLVDGRPSEDEFAALVETLVRAGVPMIQLRDKTLSDRELLSRARLLRERTAAAGILSIVNDRADIAAAAHTDGVHVGQDDLSVAAARSIVGPRMLVGVSTHSIEQARQAVLDGANYIGVGPTFPSGTKQFAAFPGVELLRGVAAEIRLPALAIGGVTLDNFDQVLAAGATRAAVSGAVCAASDPAAAAGEFIRRLGATG